MMSEKRNILVLGSGGREHALAWKIAQSPLLDTLYCAPGNGGMAQLAEMVALDMADHQAVIEFCRDKAIGLVVIGPEAPLVASLVLSPTPANTEYPECSIAMFLMSSIMFTVFPTPAPPNKPTFPPFAKGQTRSITLIPVSRISLESARST